MDGLASTFEGDRVTMEDAKSELERLLSDPRFHVTDRNRAFLRYIVDVRLSGQSRGVKAYSVAIDIFGRSSDFDPNMDPIVRIEATRLRTSLDQYYEAFAGPGQVRISLPRGNYIAEFSRIADDQSIPNAEAPRQENNPVEPPQGDAAIAGHPASYWRWQVIAGAACLGVVLGLSLFLLLGHSFGRAQPHSSGLTDRPRVTLSASVRDRRHFVRASTLDDSLLIALSRFGTLRISMDSLQSDVAQQTRSLSPPVPPGQSQYRISIKYDFADGNSSATWRIVDPQSGETLASGREMEDTGQSPDQMDAKLVSALAVRFGSSLDVLNSLERNRPLPADTKGNICVLRGEHAINTFDGTELNTARACLEATIAADGTAIDAKALLARILALQADLSGTTANLALATKMSNEASSMAPDSDRSLLARMYVQYAGGQLESAFATGRTAMSGNPLNADIAGALALRLYLNGSFAEGAEIANEVSTNLDASSRAANLVLALDAYLKGDQAEALRRLDKIVDEGGLGRCIRIGALARLGKRDEAVAAFDATLGKYSQFPTLTTKIIRLRHLDPRIEKALAQDVATVAAVWNSRHRRVNQ